MQDPSRNDLGVIELVKDTTLLKVKTDNLQQQIDELNKLAKMLQPLNVILGLRSSLRWILGILVVAVGYLGLTEFCKTQARSYAQRQIIETLEKDVALKVKTELDKQVKDVKTIRAIRQDSFDTLKDIEGHAHRADQLVKESRTIREELDKAKPIKLSVFYLFVDYYEKDSSPQSLGISKSPSEKDQVTDSNVVTISQDEPKVIELEFDALGSVNFFGVCVIPTSDLSRHQDLCEEINAVVQNHSVRLNVQRKQVKDVVDSRCKYQLFVFHQ